ncbi:unnamed protein product [Prorocentrum cordatum]|uniref:Derlin n=1 Tax=Prorocentrum cordatum TaxID=2364126 RepID=A0ABN9XX18_9DINO|nr:unnamed protein product [Polarella glacialis]
MNLNVVLGQQLPPVTLSLGVASVTLMCLCSLEVITPLDLYLNWNLVLYEMQLWRLVTCFLFFGDFGLAFFWNIHVLMHYPGVGGLLFSGGCHLPWKDCGFLVDVDLWCGFNAMPDVYVWE